MAGPLLPGFSPSLVSSLYTLSALQVSVVAPIHWPPSARLPSGSVLAFAVTAVFYATVSEALSVACGLSSSPWVSATAPVVLLHPVSITGYNNGSFGFSASLSRRVFSMWSPLRVESVSVLYRSDDSSSTFLVFGWSLHDEVTLTGRVCLRSRSERRLFAHLP